MAIQLSSVARYLQSKNVSFKETENGGLLVGFEVETSAGKTDAVMLFTNPLEGKVFSVESGGFLPKEIVAKLIGDQRFILSLLNMAWRTPFGGCELSSDAEELRFVVEVPLMDGTLTEEQFHTIIDGVRHGTKAVCELALEALGKGTGGTEEIVKKLNAAADVLTSQETSAEEKKAAVEFIVAVANDEGLPTEVRAMAAKLANAIKEAIAEIEGKSSGSSPFA